MRNSRSCLEVRGMLESASKIAWILPRAWRARGGPDTATGREARRSSSRAKPCGRDRTVSLRQRLERRVEVGAQTEPGVPRVGDLGCSSLSGPRACFDRDLLGTLAGEAVPGFLGLAQPVSCKNPENTLVANAARQCLRGDLVGVDHHRHVTRFQAKWHRAGGDASPTDAIIDSQSVKRRKRGASDRSAWVRRGQEDQG